MDQASYITNANADKLLHEESPVDSEESTESSTLIFGSLHQIFEDLDENKDLIHSAIGLSGLLIPLNEPFESSKLEIAQSEQFSISYNEADLSGFSNRIMDSHVASNITTGLCGEAKEEAQYKSYEYWDSIFGIPVDFDLFEAFGSSFPSQMSGFLGYEALPIDIQDFPHGIGPSSQDLGEGDAKVKAEDLLEAVIASFGDGLDGTSPNSSETLLSPAAQVVQCDPIASSRSQNKLNELVKGGGHISVLWNNIESAFDTGNRNSSSKHSNSASSRSMASCLTDKEQPKDGQKHQLSGSKRKGRSGDSQRPRPRDRQLIQDRVKELRELVPNGSKVSLSCSSALLCLM